MTQQGTQGFLLSNGSVSSTTNVLPGGSYTVVAQYPGDGTFGPSTSSPISVTVAKEASKTQIDYELFNPVTGLQTNPDATTAVFGTLSILRVNVTSQAGDACPTNALGSSGCPTGSFTLTDSYNGGSANPLNAGTYALNSEGYADDLAIDLPGGTHAIQASYSGDNSYTAPAGPTTDAITITQAPTTTTISGVPSVTTVGSVVNLDATVTAQNIFSNISPNVTVSFFVGNTLVATAGGGDITSGPGPGQVSFFTGTSTSSLPHGQLSIIGKCSGDTSYAPSTSAPITISVLYPTATTVSSSNATIQRGTSVTFTAQVMTSQSGAPPITGTVLFAVDSVAFGAPVTISNGQAQISTSSLSSGFHTITAEYQGDSNFAISVGSTSETVMLIGTTTAVSSSANTITQGMNVTFTATITPAQGGGPAASGTVQFASNGSNIGAPANVSNGKSQLQTTSLPVGTDQITAAYSGDSNYAGSTSLPVSEAVTPAPDFSAGANPTTIVISSPGASGSTMLTFMALNGLSGTFNLVSQCGGLPAESNCSVSPSSITFSSTVTSATATLMIGTTAQSSAAATARMGPNDGRSGALIALSVFFLVSMLQLVWKQRRIQIAFSVFAFLALLTFASCGGGGGGGGGNQGTPPGVYPNVSASFTLGSTSHSVALTVNVK